ncbi:DoxX family membrane protein [Flavobacteriaceae bacterium R38]|nr:DoxX family membrane protein [Flavobacteriaceae bacterium R38]
MNSKLIIVLRILLGLMLVVFGANKFFEFLPPFEFANPDAGTFFGALANSYVLKTVGLIEVIVGILLLLGKAVPFALILLAPISVNIILFHGTLDPPNIGPAAFVFLVNTFLIYSHWDSYKALFK